jgi:hypothetical protein
MCKLHNTAMNSHTDKDPCMSSSQLSKLTSSKLPTVTPHEGSDDPSIVRSSQRRLLKPEMHNKLVIRHGGTESQTKRNPPMAALLLLSLLLLLSSTPLQAQQNITLGPRTAWLSHVEATFCTCVKPKKTYAQIASNTLTSTSNLNSVALEKKC